MFILKTTVEIPSPCNILEIFFLKGLAQVACLMLGRSVIQWTLKIFIDRSVIIKLEKEPITSLGFCFVTFYIQIAIFVSVSIVYSRYYNFYFKTAELLLSNKNVQIWQLPRSMANVLYRLKKITNILSEFFLFRQLILPSTK